MTDPARLRDVGDAFETSLLAAGRGDAAGEHLERAVCAALGVGAGTLAATSLGAAAGAGAAGSGGTKAAVTLAVLKWAVGVSVAAVALGGAAARVWPPEPRATGATVAPAARRTAAASAPLVPERTTATETASPASTLAATPPMAMPASASPVASPSQTDLRAEVAPLDAARAALAAGETARALDLVNRHDLDFVHGQLEPEALALRIEIYQARGDQLRVTELGARFLSRYPGHPQAARVHAIVLAAKAPGSGAPRP